MCLAKVVPELSQFTGGQVRGLKRESAQREKVSVYVTACCECAGLAVACLTAVREVPGSNRAEGSCVYRKNHCDLQPWAWVVCTFPAVHRLTQPSTPRGMVNEYQLLGWVIIINGDVCCSF